MGGRQQRNINVGAAILFVIFSLLFFVLLARFAYIQATGEAGGQVLAAKAEQKYRKAMTIDASRGSILDRNGEVIAQDTTSFKLVAVLDDGLTTNEKNPRHVVDPQKTSQQLAEFIDLEEQAIYEILTKENRKQVEFGKAGRDLSNTLKNEIEQLSLPGITFMRETQRFYPNGIFATHLIGYADREIEEDGTSFMVGKLGLERSLQEQLKGTPGSLTFNSDSYGFLLPNTSPVVVPAENGDDVYITIDKKIQTFLEDALSKVDADYTPENLLAIVANPKTGDILAMSQRPTFHPKTKEGLEKTWHNEVIEASFEPGSTMKIFTLAAAVEENVFHPNELYKSGSYTVGPDTIRDHNRVGWGEISFLEGVQRSSNVAFSKLATEKMSSETFHDYLLDFGFNQPTGIDLPNETSGHILFNYPIERVTTSYGQGTTLTPIQQIQAMTAIANEGKMMKPQIIDKIVDRDTGEIVKETKPEVVGTPISAETAAEVLNILETVISAPHGTGKDYAIEGYEVVGKTGTAQIPGPDGKYLTGANNYIFSFLGAAPKDDPELVMYVAIKQPELDGRRGADAVSSVFKTVMKHSLQYLNIKPAELKKTEAHALPDVKKQQVDVARESLNELAYNVVVLGNGVTVVDQHPAPATKLLEGERVILKTEGATTVPDMTGWSFRDVLKVAYLAELELNKTGSGYVTQQSVSPGSEVTPNDYLVVELKTPLQILKQGDSSVVTEGEMIPTD